MKSLNECMKEKYILFLAIIGDSKTSNMSNNLSELIEKIREYDNEKYRGEVEKLTYQAVKEFEVQYK